jgi:D-cysteine desulfhydrase
LALGLRIAGLRARVVGVVVAHQLRLDTRVVTRLAGRAAVLLRRHGAEVGDVRLRPEDLLITREWLGAGYGHRTADSERALALAAAREGLELDPVYTAKAMAALLALNARGRFGENPVLFVNTYDSLSRRSSTT